MRKNCFDYAQDTEITMRRFQSRIDKGEHVEARLYAPAGYRHLYTADIAARALEVIGMQTWRELDNLLPGLHPNKLAKTRTKAVTDFILAARRRNTGYRGTELIEQLHSGKAKYSNIFNYPALNWADIAIGWPVDGAGYWRPGGSAAYGLYSRHGAYLQRRKSHQRQDTKLWPKWCGTKDQQARAGKMLWTAGGGRLAMFWSVRFRSTTPGDAVKCRTTRETNDELAARSLLINHPSGWAIGFNSAR